jgi:hypothetical protein
VIVLNGETVLNSQFLSHLGHPYVIHHKFVLTIETGVHPGFLDNFFVYINMDPVSVPIIVAVAMSAEMRLD